MKVPGSSLLALTFALLVSMHLPAREDQERPEIDVAARVRLVEVTVQVLDAEGNHVTGLKREGFILEANGSRRDLRLFEPVATGLERFTNRPTLGVDYHPLTAQELNGLPERYYMLLFHQVQFRFGAFQRAKAAALEFIENHMLPNDHVKLVGFDKVIDFETDFLNDKSAVLAELEKMHLKHRNISMRDAFFVYLQNEADTLARLPGKASIILIAEGMQGVGGATTRGVYERTIEKLQKADVRIYGVDAGGLNLKDPGASVARFSPGLADKIYQSFNLGLYSGPTGGRYFRYHNNIGNLLAQVDYEMSAYYILGFHLREDELEERIDIQVTLPSHPDVELFYKDTFLQ